MVTFIIQDYHYSQKPYPNITECREKALGKSTLYNSRHRAEYYPEDDQNWNVCDSRFSGYRDSKSGKDENKTDLVVFGGKVRHHCYDSSRIETGIRLLCSVLWYISRTLIASLSVSGLPCSRSLRILSSLSYGIPSSSSSVWDCQRPALGLFSSMLLGTPRYVESFLTSH